MSYSLKTTLTIGEREKEIDAVLTFDHSPACPRTRDYPGDPETVEFWGFEAITLRTCGEGAEHEFHRADREDWFTDLDRLVADAVDDAMQADGYHSDIAAEALDHVHGLREAALESAWEARREQQRLLMEEASLRG